MRTAPVDVRAREPAVLQLEVHPAAAALEEGRHISHVGVEGLCSTGRARAVGLYPRVVRLEERAERGVINANAVGETFGNRNLRLDEGNQRAVGNGGDHRSEHPGRGATIGVLGLAETCSAEGDPELMACMAARPPAKRQEARRLERGRCRPLRCGAARAGERSLGGMSRGRANGPQRA